MTHRLPPEIAQMPHYRPTAIDRTRIAADLAHARRVRGLVPTVSLAAPICFEKGR